MWYLVTLIVGVFIGFVIERTITKLRLKPVGRLRFDTSDPEDGPYLFLEVDKGKSDQIYEKNFVILDTSAIKR